MKRLWVVATFVLLACGDLFAPPTESRMFTIPDIYRWAWWPMTTECSAIPGDLTRIHWRAVPAGRLLFDGHPVAGVWEPPHTIWLDERFLNTEVIVRHEMLHDLIQTGKHPPVFARCGLALP